MAFDFALCSAGRLLRRRNRLQPSRTTSPPSSEGLPPGAQDAMPARHARRAAGVRRIERQAARWRRAARRPDHDAQDALPILRGGTRPSPPARRSVVDSARYRIPRPDPWRSRSGTDSDGQAMDRTQREARARDWRPRARPAAATHSFSGGSSRSAGAARRSGTGSLRILPTDNPSNPPVRAGSARRDLRRRRRHGRDGRAGRCRDEHGLPGNPRRLLGDATLVHEDSTSAVSSPPPGMGVFPDAVTSDAVQFDLPPPGEVGSWHPRCIPTPPFAGAGPWCQIRDENRSTGYFRLGTYLIAPSAWWATCSKPQGGHCPHLRWRVRRALRSPGASFLRSGRGWARAGRDGQPGCCSHLLALHRRAGSRYSVASPRSWWPRPSSRRCSWRR